MEHFLDPAILTMEQNVKNKGLVFFIQMTFFFCDKAWAAPCEGPGTAIIYGNGIFNTKRDAYRNLDSLMSIIKERNFIDSKKDLKEDIAFQSSGDWIGALATVAAQKGIDEFEYFWLWLASITKSPDWFREYANQFVLESFQQKQFPDLEDQFEKYGSNFTRFLD